jgi:hypothetical protein
MAKNLLAVFKQRHGVEDTNPNLFLRHAVRGRTVVPVDDALVHVAVSSRIACAHRDPS